MGFSPLRTIIKKTRKTWDATKRRRAEIIKANKEAKAAEEAKNS